jgi:hypothetical protein
MKNKNVSPEKRTKASLADILLCIVFCTLILSFSLAFWLTADETVSYQENRELAQMPELSAEAVLSGSFTADIAEYYADQFPWRQGLLRLAATYELSLLSFESDSIMLGSGGYLIARNDWYDSAKLSENAENIGRFADWAKGHSIEFTVAVPGRSQDVLSKYAPAFYSGRSDSLTEQIAAEFGFADNVDLISPLRKANDDGFYVYYKTDHHWTTLGAYLAYVELGQTLGYEPYDSSEFDIEIASEDFYGTTWSASGIRTNYADRIEFWRWDGDDELICESSGSSLDGLYDYSYLDGKDKYGAFLSGNNALVTISDVSSEREKLLIIKDSFAHSLAPFLARHYDIVLVDLRYYNKSCAQLCVEMGVDRVLLLCNADTLYSSGDFRKLNMGLN